MTAPRGSAAARRPSLIDVSYGNWSGWRKSRAAQVSFLIGALDRFIRIEPLHVNRLVFVCLGNINRSPFAEAVARRRGLRATSVGLNTSTGASASALAIRFAPDHGVDLASHAATDFTDFDVEAGDLLLVHETRHIAALIERGIPPASIALLGAWASPLRIHLHDPHTLSEAYHRTCFALIHSAVDKLADELGAAGSPCRLPTRR